jgi:glycosyltransferase involved in cell wall biosynthesis
MSGSQAGSERTRIGAAGTTAAFPSGINLVADSAGPTTSLTASVLERCVQPARLHVKLLDQATRHDYHLRPTLFSRVCAPEFAWVAVALARRAARYAYYLDDNLWEYRRDNALSAYYASSAVRQSLALFIRNATIVLVSSFHLADRLRTKFPESKIQYVPASFDFDLLSDQTPRAPVLERPLRVGYAGSERGGAFDAVVSAIRRTVLNLPGAFEFEFIGHMPKELVGTPGVRHFDNIPNYREFLEFKQTRGWDLALAPLEDDAFSRSKTNNKFREYGALGIPGLYSDVAPYADSVQHVRSGLLVGQGEDAWATALEWALLHREELPTMGAHAKHDVWTKHRLEVVAPQWTTALRSARLTPTTAAGSAFEWRMRRALGRLEGRVTRRTAS